jgi:hypothetical protein
LDVNNKQKGEIVHKHVHIDEISRKIEEPQQRNDFLEKGGIHSVEEKKNLMKNQ